MSSFTAQNIGAGKHERVKKGLRAGLFPFCFIISLKLVTDGLLRGSGAVASFMVATLTDLIFRVALGYILSVPFGSTGMNR